MFKSCEDGDRSFMRIRIMPGAVLRVYCEGEAKAEVSTVRDDLLKV